MGGKHFICMIQTLIKTKNSIRVDVHGNKTLAMSPKTHKVQIILNIDITNKKMNMKAKDRKIINII